MSYLEATAAMFTLTKKYAETLVDLAKDAPPEHLNAAFAFMGMLQNEENRLTGAEDDVAYLISSDPEKEKVIGIAEKPTSLKDSEGRALRIGDMVTVTMNGVSADAMVSQTMADDFNSGFPRTMTVTKKHSFEDVPFGELENERVTIVSCLETYQDSPLYDKLQDQAEEGESQCPQL